METRSTNIAKFKYFFIIIFFFFQNSKITIEPYGFLSKFELIPFAARFLCIHPPIDKICREILYMIAGFNSPQINSVNDIL